MSFLEALVLGIVQGLTEFLPVSSSGHLEIISHLFGIDPDHNMIFTIVLHGGTVLSTLVVFRKQIADLLRGLFRFEMNQQTQFVLRIMVSLIPIMIVGFTLKDKLEVIFSGSLFFVGCMLLLTAVLLFFSYKAKRSVRKMTYWDAFVIGIAQAVAVLPGLSRSGSTISTALMLGVKREEAASFSFLMVLVPIIGMNVLSLITGQGGSSALSIGLMPLIVGFVSSFLTGMLACRLMIRLVTNGKLIWFALYCLVVGVTILVSTLC